MQSKSPAMAAHIRGIAHRGLKPANNTITKTGATLLRCFTGVSMAHGG